MEGQSSFAGIQGLRGIVFNPQSLSGGSVEVDARGAMALGQGGACDYCQARGLCRKDFWSAA